MNDEQPKFVCAECGKKIAAPICQQCQSGKVAPLIEPDLEPMKADIWADSKE